MKKIKLTEAEHELYIRVSNFNPNDEYELRIQSLNDCAKLKDLLIKRNAIPLRRLEYLKAEFNNGNSKKSKLEIFESNGTRGIDVASHPHFLKYLLYFINGANVPESIIEFTYQSKNNNVYQEDSTEEIFNFLRNNNFIPLEKHKRTEFSEEMLKLFIDFEYDLSNCLNMRKLVQSNGRIKQ